jgi:Fe-S cluster assembly iron-binding protein IscA
MVAGSIGAAFRYGRPVAIIEFTDEAIDAIAAAHGAATRFNPSARIRIAPAGGGVGFSFVDGPETGDRVVAAGSVEVFVAPRLTGTVDVGEHERLFLRPHP